MATKKYRTMQNMFDTAVKGIIKQGKPSIVKKHGGPGVCRYRGRNGLKCAIGHLITDSKYSAKLEGISLLGNNLDGGVAIDRILEAANIDPRDQFFAANLQHLHDGCPSFGDGFLTEFKKSARRFAEAHNLSTKVLDVA